MLKFTENVNSMGWVRNENISSDNQEQNIAHEFTKLVSIYLDSLQLSIQ